MRIRWSQAAIGDMGEIVRFIRMDSAEAARRVKARFSKEVTELGRMPHSGRTGDVEDTRELVLPWSYIAVYRISGGDVPVLRIRHAAQEWLAN